MALIWSLLLHLLATFLAPVAALVLGGVTKSPSVGIASLVILWGLIFWRILGIYKRQTRRGRLDMSAWLQSKNHCKVEREYPYEQIREWGWEIPGYDTTTVIGRADMQALTQTTAMNMASLSNAVENIGVWVSVRDVDYPRWFIRTEVGEKSWKEIQHGLERWQEILNQEIAGR
ncbi:MAG: hypothetical protein B7Y99_10470 [Caulobacterales bacterium 32-69-10]|nr:MAG: hypothetical protein B7Y99_10470 [Caulobacterales bacterium 32-69-10]